MKWFKHHSDNYRGRSVYSLYEELGHLGISCYYVLMEICTEKLDGTKAKRVEEGDCKFSFSRLFVRRCLRVTEAKLDSFLNQCAELGLLSFEYSGKDIHIYMPILLDLLDSDFKKTRSRREMDALKTPLEKEKEKEKEKDIIYAAEPSQASPAGLYILAELWNEHTEGLPKIKSCESKRLKKAKAIFSKLTKDEWIDAIKRIKRSEFLCGSTGWKANFDWFIREGNYLKIIEGNYDGGAGGGQSLAERLRQINEEEKGLQKCS